MSKKSIFKPCEICEVKPATRVHLAGQEAIICCQKCYDTLDKGSDLIENLIEKIFRECGRPIEFLDCTATCDCQSKTPTVKPKRR
jgi:hypothetical protein